MRVSRRIRAGRHIGHRIDGIAGGGSDGAGWELLIAANVKGDVCRSRGIAALFALFQCPLHFGGVNEAEVVEAGVALGSLPGLYKIGKGNRRQQADDGHNNHDFYEREARLAVFLNQFHDACFVGLSTGKLAGDKELFFTNRTNQPY